MMAANKSKIWSWVLLDFLKIIQFKGKAFRYNWDCPLGKYTTFSETIWRNGTTKKVHA